MPLKFINKYCKSTFRFKVLKSRSKFILNWNQPLINSARQWTVNVDAYKINPVEFSTSLREPLLVSTKLFVLHIMKRFNVNDKKSSEIIS